LAVDISIVL